MTGLEVIMLCAPQVAPVTMAAIVQQESGGKPWTINDNTAGRRYVLIDEASAVALARRLIAQRHSIDLGLAQINNGNLGWLKVPVEKIFDPCTNLRAGQQVLMSAWKQAGGNLQGALQAYNSGRTIGEKYAAGVYRQAGVIVPAIPGGQLAEWAAKPLASRSPPDLDVKVGLPPVRLRVKWTPEGSPLAPRAGDILPQERE